MRHGSINSGKAEDTARAMVGAAVHKVNVFALIANQVSRPAKRHLMRQTGRLGENGRMTPLAEIDLVLASTSRYRRELLERLTSRFRVESPQVDESAPPGLTPTDLAARLAIAKASAVSGRNPGALIIGSDQVADCGGVVLGKPGNIEQARQQLRASSGSTVVFHTAVCLVDTRSKPMCAVVALDTTSVLFRTLDDAEIDRYIERERPLDCAGSFKSEGLGIGLFERIESADPTALIGLPLIALCKLLRQAGITAI